MTEFSVCTASSEPGEQLSWRHVLVRALVVAGLAFTALIVGVLAAGTTAAGPPPDSVPALVSVLDAAPVSISVTEPLVAVAGDPVAGPVLQLTRR